jgi:hypothetical protein
MGGTEAVVGSEGCGTGAIAAKSGLPGCVRGASRDDDHHHMAANVNIANAKPAKINHGRREGGALTRLGVPRGAGPKDCEWMLGTAPLSRSASARRRASRM